MLGRGAVFGFAASAVPALMPLVARDLVGGGALTYGLLLGGFGAGAVGGAFLSGRLRHALSTEGVVRWSSAAFAAASVGTVATSSLVVAMASLALAGAGWVLALSTFNVTVQMSAPRWVVARALALYQMTTFGGMAAGSWAWGVVAADHGVAAALIWAAVLMVLGGIVLGLRISLPEAQDLNLDPLRTFAAPSIAIDIEPRSGPVVITIEYRIAERDVLEFLSVMAERRRIRRRDGARHWTLLRDLQDPQLWVERYHTPTWLDYIRHNQRITQADAEISRRVQALHRGEGPPVVHRMIERQTGSLPAGRAPGPREMADPMTDPTRSS